MTSAKTDRQHGQFNLWVWLGLIMAGILISEFFIERWEQREQQAEWLQILDEANRSRVILEAELNAAASLASGVSLYVATLEGQLDTDNLNALLARIYERGSHFRNIGLAPNNRITYIYPLSGNEAALGVEYEKLPDQWPTIQSMIDTREGRLAGPLPLVQGGIGLLFREPIFVGDTYWGLLSTVLDADSILSLLTPLIDRSDIHVALRGVDAQGPDGAVFLGEETWFSEADTVLDIYVPGGSWQMAVVQSHHESGLQPGLRILIWLLTTGLVLAVALLAQIPFQNLAVKRLEQAVSDRTSSLAETNALLSSVLDAAREFAIIATDTRGNITLFNRGAELMLRYEAEALIGQPLSRLLWPSSDLHADATPVEKLIESVRSGQTEAGEWIYRRQDDSTLPVWLVFSPIADEKEAITGYLSIASDLTERHRIERLKNEFLSVVSHELRTPITSIKGALSLLRHGYADYLTDDGNRLLSVAERNNARLLSLINDLLDINKLEANQLQLRPEAFPLTSLLDEAVGLAAGMAEKNSVSLILNVTDPALEVMVDEQRFQQVMANLLSNAIKFSPQNGQVTVTVRRENDHCRISVCDQGHGVKTEFKPYVFDKFSQADGSDQRILGGTGLGLAISKELVTRMGGKIGVGDAPSKEGALFWFTVPLLHQSDA